MPNNPTSMTKHMTTYSHTAMKNNPTSMTNSHTFITTKTIIQV